MLIECAHYIERNKGNPKNLTLQGQEKNLGTWAICKMNMLLHGLPDARIEKGDTIRDPKLVHEGEPLLYDRVIANPPFSLDEWGREVAENDWYGRFRFGIPPKTKGDLAFVQHMVAVLNADGQLGVVMPHGVLFRGSSEGKIRQGMLEEDLFEAVIGLPSHATNIFVMVDEAHRTQYRSLAANMRHALPNACFLGFTGTPIDKKDRSTLVTFGPYIDTYTIEEAVRDGATVPIFYESRMPELHIIGQTIDQVFDHVFADRSEEERAAIKQRFATEQNIAGAPRRIEAICLNLIDHFTQFIAPNGFKAQVVAVNRDMAVTYKETLDRLNGPESAIIMSSAHNDEERLARWHLRKDDQDRLIERFKDKDDPLAILVVCDMLLTGFDVPVEQVMYLDSPLKEHTLLQAIARVNRPYGDDKTYGLVVDYWGVSEELQDALAIFSTTDIQGALQPKVDELPRLQTRHAAAMRFFQKVADKTNLDACVRVLEPEDVRAEFDVSFRRFSQSMDMMLPDTRALAYNTDLRWLGKIRGTARARYHDDRLDLSGCGEKVRQLIADAVVADGIEILVTEVPLFSPEFDEKVKALKTDDAKASEMEHAIRHEINVRVEENPVFYQSLRERLEEIIKDRRQERIDEAKQLTLLASLRDELQGEQTKAQDIGLDARGFAIYGLLEQQRPATVKEDQATYNEANRDLPSLIDEAVEPFTDLVDWWQKDDVQRQMRSKIKRQLRATGIDADKVEALASDIVDLAKVRLDR